MPSGYPRKNRGNPFDLNLPVEESIRQYAITWGRVALERTKENEEEARKALSDIALDDDLLRAAIDFLGLQVAVRLALGEKCLARGYTVCAGERRPVVAGKRFQEGGAT